MRHGLEGILDQVHQRAARPASIHEKIGGAGTDQDLQPESSRSLNAGIVLEPAKGLSLTVDYYRIRIEDLVVVVPQERAYEIARRALDLRTNMASPLRFALYCAYNPLYRREAFKRQNLRLGAT